MRSQGAFWPKGCTEVAFVCAIWLRLCRSALRASPFLVTLSEDLKQYAFPAERNWPYA